MFRRLGEVELREEGEERNREMLALMPSDPPSSDPIEVRDEDEPLDGEEDRPQIKPKVTVGLGRPSTMVRTSSTDYLGRATSLDIFASSSRAKQLMLPGPPRSVSGPSSSFEAPRVTEKRTLPPVASHDDPSKRVRLERQGPRPILPDPTLRHRDSFSRSSSAAILGAPPTPQTRSPGLTRSYSFSSTSSTLTSIAENSFHRNDIHPGNTVYSRSMTLENKRNPDETDHEVLDAASKLLQMLGGS